MTRRALFIITLFLSMIASTTMEAQQVIDVHSHMIPQSYLDYLKEIVPQDVENILYRNACALYVCNPTH